MNEQIKKKISYRLRGRPKSATTRKRISQALRGKHKSDRHKQAIAEAMVTYWKIKKTHFLKKHKDEH